jgi:hypothetical protein
MNNKYFYKLWLIPVLLTIFITGCWENREGIIFPFETTAPTVNSTSPVNASPSENINIKITATFSEEMDIQTISTSTFMAANGTQLVAGTVTYSGSTAILTPADNLQPNTLYTCTITTGVKDKKGNAMEENYVWTFTTGSAPDITAPIISFTDPANSATNVAFNKKIAVTFSEMMDPSSINTSSIILNHGTVNVIGAVSYSGVTAIFTPAVNLLPNTQYTGTITTQVKDLADNFLANNYVWSFTTGATADLTPPTVILTDPINFETGVSLDKSITVTFSEAIDASTVTTATFTVMQSSVFISGTVTFSGTTAVFTPSENLSPNETYTATVTTGIKDLAGNSMAANYVWSFSTGLLTQYSITLSSNPIDGGTTSGGGTFNSGSLVTVTASSETGFFFTNWTEGADIVSTNSSYSFTVTNDRALTANFANIPGQYSVTLISNPLPGGTTSGGGSFDPGASVTVSASPNSGFVFIDWNEGVNVVSTNSSYTFIINNDRILTANFAAGGQLPVPLGTSARFAILSNSAITNIPTSAITGDVGISPGVRSSITGLTNPEVTGEIFAADDPVPVPQMLIAAKADAEIAFLNANAAVRGTPISVSGNLNGLTLAPGLYESGTSIEISPGGILYLDAGGNSNAVFIIRSATSITTGPTAQVVLQGGANAANIFWTAGSAITLGTNSVMKGTLIAGTSISLLTQARLDGRALIQGAAAGQVSLDQSTIVRP